MSLFDMVSEEERREYEVKYPNVSELSKEVLLGYEKDVLGIYLSGHPLEEYEKKWRKNVTAFTSDFSLDEETGELKMRDKQYAMLGGIITDKNVRYLQNDKTMAFITVEDLFGTVEVVVFPKCYEQYGKLLDEDAKIFVAGRADVEEDKNGKLIADRIYSFDESRTELWVMFGSIEDYYANEPKLRDSLPHSGGKNRVVACIPKIKVMKPLPDEYSLDINDDIVNNLTSLFGEKNVKVMEMGIENKR
jgi:DNA polymerase-3 subunit alpha